MELAAYLNSMEHDGDVGFDAKAPHVEELLRERCRAMGLPETEIVKIEQESEAAVNNEINNEIEAFPIEACLRALPKSGADKWRRILRKWRS